MFTKNSEKGWMKEDFQKFRKDVNRWDPKVRIILRKSREYKFIIPILAQVL